MFGKMLQGCFNVKLRKSFVDEEASPDFPSAQGRGDSDRIFLFERTYPLTIHPYMLDLSLCLPCFQFVLFKSCY